MWADADAENVELPPVPWFHGFRYTVKNIDSLESQEEVRSVQFQFSAEKWMTLELDATTVKEAVKSAEIYLSQLVDDAFLEMVQGKRDRSIAFRYQFLNPVTDVIINVKNNQAAITPYN